MLDRTNMHSAWQLHVAQIRLSASNTSVCIKARLHAELYNLLSIQEQLYGQMD